MRHFYYYDFYISGLNFPSNLILMAMLQMFVIAIHH